MLHLKSTISLVISCMFSGAAWGQAAETLSTSDILNISDKYVAVEREAASANASVVSKVVTTTKGGELESLLGDLINTIDSLVVVGPVNDADFRTMWSSSLYGRLSILNLEKAMVESGKIPDDAFYHAAEQEHTHDGYVYFTPLAMRRITLPEGLVEIGNRSFVWGIHLEEINIPSTLKLIDQYAFAYCRNLKNNPLIFNEGLECIGELSFHGCRSLSGDVIFPSTLKKIGFGAFSNSNIKSINMPYGLEEIEGNAFYGSMLQKVVIPESCELTGNGHFAMNYELTQVTLPEGLKAIPDQFVNGCLKLAEINIPGTVEVIGSHAFSGNASLQSLDLPEGLRQIQTNALNGCTSLKQLVFPSTLEYLGQESCANLSGLGLRSLWSKLRFPCECGPNPFGIHGNSTTPSGIPLYVPTGCEYIYHEADGWNYFSVIAEANPDEYPSAGIEDITVDGIDEGDGAIYDLSGRRVSNPAAGQIYIKGNRKFIQNR